MVDGSFRCATFSIKRKKYQTKIDFQKNMINNLKFSSQVSLTVFGGLQGVLLCVIFTFCLADLRDIILPVVA